jgi:hypothetical protein
LPGQQFFAKKFLLLIFFQSNGKEKSQKGKKGRQEREKIILPSTYKKTNKTALILFRGFVII